MNNSRQHIKEVTQKWVKEFVLQLNLCPFAHRPFQEDKIRFSVADQESLEEQMFFFWQEIQLIEKLGSDEISNTLVIFPNTLPDFEEYLGFFELANELLENQEKEDIFQLVSFHPDYLFGDSPIDDVKHFTNRSPFPMIHILRVDEVEDAIQKHPNVHEIPDNNQNTLIDYFKKKNKK